MNIWNSRMEVDPRKCLESWFQVIVKCRTVCQNDVEQPTRLGIYYWGPRCNHKTSMIYRLYRDSMMATNDRNERKRIYYRYHRMCVLTRPYRPDSCNFDPIGNRSKKGQAIRPIKDME